MPPRNNNTWSYLLCPPVIVGRREVQKEDSWAACCFWAVREYWLPLNVSNELLTFSDLYL